MNPENGSGPDVALGFAIVSVELAIICFFLREIAMGL